MSKLVTPDGQILIPGIKELIAPVTDDERQKFEAIHFEMKVSLNTRAVLGLSLHLSSGHP